MKNILGGARDWVGDVANIWLDKERIDASVRIAQATGQQAHQLGQGLVDHDNQVPTAGPGFVPAASSGGMSTAQLAILGGIGALAVFLIVRGR